MSTRDPEERAAGDVAATIESTYRRAGFALGVYALIKLRLCPLVALERHVPRRGSILDIGCGAGILTNILAMTSAERVITAVDAAREKIRVAEAVTGTGNNVRYAVMSAADIRGSGYEGIVASDVLYLIPYAEQEKILRKCFALLSDTGSLVIKEMDRKPRWKFAFNALQETIAVKVLRFTRGQGFYFRDSDQYPALLASIGFKVDVTRLDGKYPYPHIVYVCRKK